MIVFELCQYGDLHGLLHDDHSKPLPWLLRLKIALDIAKGVKYLHDYKPYPIAHLDLKSPNVMLYDLSTATKVRAKIIDFGTSQFMETPITIRKVDNPLWLAPEVLATRPYDQRADTYAFGVICYEILTRKCFFSDQSFLSIIQESVIAGDRPVLDRELCHATFIQVIEDCWCQDPSKRPKFDVVIENLKSLLPLHKQLDKMIQKYDEQLNEEQELELDKDSDRILQEEMMKREQVSRRLDLQDSTEKKKKEGLSILGDRKDKQKKKEKKSKEAIEKTSKPGKLVLWVDRNTQNYGFYLSEILKKDGHECELFATPTELRSYLEALERGTKLIRIVCKKRDRRVDTTSFSEEEVCTWMKSHPKFNDIPVLVYCSKEKCKLQTDASKGVWVTNETSVLLDFVLNIEPPYCC